MNPAPTGLVPVERVVASSPSFARPSFSPLLGLLVLFHFSVPMLRADAPAAENAPPPPTQADRAWQSAQRQYNARRWQQAEEAYEAFRSNHRAKMREQF